MISTVLRNFQESINMFECGYFVSISIVITSQTNQELFVDGVGKTSWFCCVRSRDCHKCVMHVSLETIQKLCCNLSLLYTRII